MSVDVLDVRGVKMSEASAAGSGLLLSLAQKEGLTPSHGEAIQRPDPNSRGAIALAAGWGRLYAHDCLVGREVGGCGVASGVGGVGVVLDLELDAFRDR